MNVQDTIDELTITYIDSEAELLRARDGFASGATVTVRFGDGAYERMTQMYVRSVTPIKETGSLRVRFIEKSPPEGRSPHFVAFQNYAKEFGFIQPVSEDTP